MNFGNTNVLEFVFVALIWALPLVLMAWFIRAVTGIAASLRDIAVRLTDIERALRDARPAAPPSDR